MHKVSDRVKINEPRSLDNRKLATMLTPVSESTVGESAADFDGGFGIGGLARRVEEVSVPSLAAMKRVEVLTAKATVCRKCGNDDIFDGVMFTTDPSSGLCDDCYG